MNISIVGAMWSNQSNGNGGIVPPWLQQPPVIVLPVEPGEDDVQLPVIPGCETNTTTRGGGQ